MVVSGRLRAEEGRPEVKHHPQMVGRGGHRGRGWGGEGLDLEVEQHSDLSAYPNAPTTQGDVQGRRGGALPGSNHNVTYFGGGYKSCVQVHHRIIPHTAW